MNVFNNNSRIQRFTIFSVLLAYAITSLGVISIFTLFPEKTFAATGVTVRLIGPNDVLAETTNITAITAADAFLQTAQQLSIPHYTIQGNGSFFIKEIAGTKNWLYQINGWTPPCTAMNEYNLSSNDIVEIYHISHQYTTQTRISSSQTSASQYENWNIIAETRKPNRQSTCERPSMNAWTNAGDITITVRYPDGTKNFFNAHNSVTIQLSQPGTYSAFIWSKNMFPSNTISIHVTEATSKNTPGNEPQQNTSQQEKTPAQFQNITNNKQETQPQTEQTDSEQQPSQQSISEQTQSSQQKSGQQTQGTSLAQTPNTKNTNPQFTSTNSAGQQAHTLEGAQVARTESTIAQIGQSAEVQSQEPQQVQQQPQTEALNNAAQYLLSQKNTQGLIGDPSLNSWALIGLILAKGKDDTQVQEITAAHEAYIETIEDITVLEAEKNILLSVMLQKDPKNFGGANIEERFFRYIDDEQIGDKEALNDDVWGILTLRAMNVRQNDPMIQQSKEYILKHQHEDGGFGYNISTESDSDDTAAAITALLSAGMNAQDEAIQRAFQYLESTIDGNTGGEKHQAAMENPSAVSSAWTLQAYRAASKQEPEKMRQFILSQQQNDGSVNASPGQQQAPILTTALVMPVLANSYFPLSEAPQGQSVDHINTNNENNKNETNYEQQTQNTTNTSTGLNEQPEASSAGGSIKPSTENTESTENIMKAATYYKQKSTALEHNMNSLEETIKQWRRANTILIITIIVIIVGIVIYTVLFHTNIFNKNIANL